MKLTTKIFVILFSLSAATAASANPFPDGNAQTGQKLFDQYKCNSCHDQMMGGDGNKIFTRLTRKVNSANGLIDQIGLCGGNVNAHFTSQQILDFAAYLNNFYKFK